MRIADIMTPRVQTIAPDVYGFEAWELMKRKAIRHLVVVDGGKVVGLLSERDAGGRPGANIRANLKVADLMTSHVISIEPDAPVKKAANLMRGRTIGCLPVLKGRKLVGIVTASDLLELVGRGGARPAPAERRTLNHRVPHRKMHVASGVW